MAGGDDENERLQYAEYWDERYSETKGDHQLHEWFRSFGDLDEFFSRYLFKEYPSTADPQILHLGSGDSVSSVHWITTNGSFDDKRRQYHKSLLPEAIATSSVLISLQ